MFFFFFFFFFCFTSRPLSCAPPTCAAGGEVAGLREQVDDGGVRPASISWSGRRAGRSPGRGSPRSSCAARACGRVLQRTRAMCRRGVVRTRRVEFLGCERGPPGAQDVPPGSRRARTTMTASHITAQPITTPAPAGVGLGTTLYFETVAAGGGAGAVRIRPDEDTLLRVISELASRSATSRPARPGRRGADPRRPRAPHGRRRRRGALGDQASARPRADRRRSPLRNAAQTVSASTNACQPSRRRSSGHSSARRA